MHPFNSANVMRSCDDVYVRYGSALTQATIRPSLASSSMQTQCDFAHSRGWTLVYKGAGSGMKTTAQANLPALLDPASGTASGKMSDADIRTLCAGQYRIDQFNQHGSRMPYNPLYCSFVSVDAYGDNRRTAKYCSRTYSASDNYNGAPSGAQCPRANAQSACTPMAASNLAPSPRVQRSRASCVTVLRGSLSRSSQQLAVGL